MSLRARLFPPRLEAGHGSPFLQIWMIALAFALSSTLFFISAMIDLKDLEGMLHDVRTRKAQYVIGGIERASAKEFDYLVAAESYGVLSSGSSVYRQAFSAQDSLGEVLIERAKSLGNQELTHGLSRDSLSAMAASEVFSVIVVLGENDETSIQTGPLPDVLTPEIQALRDGNEEVSLHLSGEADVQNSFSYVFCRRRGAKGAVILVLDAEGLRHWRLKIAIQKAIEELGWVGGVTYISIEDNLGRLLAQGGKAPGGNVQDPSAMVDAVKGSKDTAGQRPKPPDTKSIVISLPFQFHDKAIGTARVGIEALVDGFVIENRRHTYIWTGLIVLTGLFSMGLLYQTQNRHISRLQAIQERLHQAEKLSSLAKLAAGVAHEVRNPLNAISMATQRLQIEFEPTEGKSREEFDRITYIVRDEIHRLDAIVEDFLNVSRSDRLDLHPQPIMDLLRRLSFLIREEVGTRGVRIEEPQLDLSFRVLMDVNKMEQALLNIVKNAVESISGEGSISIGVEDSGSNRVTIKVQDTGAGITQEELGRIFDPYFTTKANGIGIGLYIAHEIIAAHGGEILVHSAPGKGTTFEILLPLEVG